MEMTLGSWHIAIERTRPDLTQLSQMYDADASRWHRAISRRGYLLAYANLFRRLRRHGPLRDLPNPARILDCGIGTAALSLSLAQQTGLKLQLDGVDISPRMLREAGQVLGEAGLNLTPHCRSADRLTFADHTFDLAMSAHMLEHMPRPLTALQEMVRVLRPGAPLVVVISKPSLYTAFIQMRWRYTAYHPNQVIAWLNEAGLSQVNLYDLNGSIPRRTSLAYVGVKPG